MKLPISDVTITVRMVEVPDRCPNCEADLTETDSIEEFSYLDVSYRGALDKTGKTAGLEYGDQGFNWHGNANIVGMNYMCRACDHVLAEGLETRSP